jgi:hypothetical protein
MDFMLLRKKLAIKRSARENWHKELVVTRDERSDGCRDYFSPCIINVPAVVSCSPGHLGSPMSLSHSWACLHPRHRITLGREFQTSVSREPQPSPKSCKSDRKFQLAVVNGSKSDRWKDCRPQTLIIPGSKCRLTSTNSAYCQITPHIARAKIEIAYSDAQIFWDKCYKVWRYSCSCILWQVCQINLQ